MLYNLLIDWEDQTNESGLTEPVTVQEVKNYLRLEGFIDSSESISSEFNDDDVLIANLITSARERLEEFTGLSFIPKTWQIEFTTSFNKRVFKTPTYENMVMTYEAGYTTLPKGLKDAMLKEVAYRYINRGDENVDGMSREAMVLASKYKTDNWIG
jgi:hypothetical protein